MEENANRNNLPNPPNYPNPPNHANLPPLLRAIENGSPIEEIIHLLEEDEKSLFVTDDEGRTALVHAFLAHQPRDYLLDVIHLLLDYGADATGMEEFISHDHILYFDDPTLFERVFERGMSVDARHPHQGSTILMDLLTDYTEVENEEEGYPLEDAIQQIIQHHPDLDLQDKRGDTALHLALSGTITPFLGEILPYLATPSTFRLENNAGQTPLHRYASRPLPLVQRDAVEPPFIVDFLLQRGSDPLARDFHHQTASERARAQGNHPLAALLQRKEQEARRNLQGTVVQRGRQGQQRVPSAVARRITHFLGGKRKGRKSRKGRKTRKGRKRTSRRS